MISSIRERSIPSWALSEFAIRFRRPAKAAATTCRIVEGGRPAGGAGQLVQTPIVPGGGSLVFTARVTALGETPNGLAVDCQSP
jgi:hypothetical protein